MTILTQDNDVPRSELDVSPCPKIRASSCPKRVEALMMSVEEGRPRAGPALPVNLDRRDVEAPFLRGVFLLPRGYEVGKGGAEEVYCSHDVSFIVWRNVSTV